MSHGLVVRVSLSLLLIGLLLPLIGCGSGSSPPSTGAAATPVAPSSASGGGGYLGALAQGFQKGQETQTLAHLKQIGIAFQNYHATHNSFPVRTGEPTGKSRLSWRVEILPYIEEQTLYKEFKTDEDWDSPHNKKLLEKMPDLYRDPRFQTKESKPTTTHFQGFIGDGGVLGVPGGAALGLISNSNGASNTLLVVEAGNAVPWTKPEDLVHDPNKPVPPLGGPKGSPFFCAVFCDGTVRRIPSTADEKTLRYMIQWDNPTPFVMPGGK
jgi:hypothetical protein